MALSEVVKFSDFYKVREKIPDYQPGTFGIEIELVINDESVNEDLADSDWREYILDHEADLKDDWAGVTGKHRGNNPSFNLWLSESGRKWEYLNKEKYLNVTGFFVKLLEDLGQNVLIGSSNPDSWGIGLDGELLEIRSRYLKVSDFDLLRELFKRILDAKKWAVPSGGASAHIHIGLQKYKDFNYMDLLSVIDIVDEDKMYALAGKFREIKYTKDKRFLENLIAKQLSILFDDNKRELIISNKDLGIIAAGFERHIGINLKSFFDHKTLEFRYLSSKILNNIEEFLKSVEYFLLIPEIARRKMQIIIRGEDEVFWITRMTGNSVKVTKTPTSKTDRPIPDTRKNVFSKYEQKIRAATIEKIKAYYYNRTVSEFVSAVERNISKLNPSQVRIFEKIKEYAKSKPVMVKVIIRGSVYKDGILLNDVFTRNPAIDILAIDFLKDMMKLDVFNA